MTDDPLTNRRQTQLDSEQFRVLGHELVDRIGNFLATLPTQPIKSEWSARRIRELIGNDKLPKSASPAGEVLDRASELLCQHAMSTSHPRFWAYIMGAASPIAALADLLAAAVNPPMTSYSTSALTVAMESQTVAWMAELVGYPVGGSGLFLSGGSIANLVAFRVALVAKAGFDVNTHGLTGAAGEALCFYATADAHSSIVATAEICGLGTRAMRLVELDANGRMDVKSLRRLIQADRQAGKKPFMVVAIAGTTTLGAVDPLSEIAALCRQEDLWFHVDGAYGGVAVVSPEAPVDLRGLREADSLVIDPHKWLYMPADVGCLLTRDRHALFDAFCQGAPYYADNEEQNDLGGPETLQFRDLGPQTTRSFRALKVRLALQTVGAEGCKRMITDDILLARRLYELAFAHPELEALTHSLSITTFRYVPAELPSGDEGPYLDELNKKILHVLQARGSAYPSHTLVQGKFAIRVCIVNYNTSLADIEALPVAVAEIGAELTESMSHVLA